MLNGIVRTPAKILILYFTFLLSAGNVCSQPQISYDPVITSGLSLPMEVVTAPGDVSGRLFIVQKSGTILIWNGTSLLASPFLDISAISVDDDERGLLSMAFHPDYASNGFFFVYYNDNAGNITIARYQVSADPNIANPTPNPASPLLSIPKPFNNHNGGHLQFRTEGGINYLYFATGDGGSGNDPFNNAQDNTSLLGNMIRMNVDAATPVPEIWAWGLRNPFRWSFDRATGDMWIGDVGQGLKEEVNFRAGGTYGANYGWPCFEALLPNSSAPSQGDCDTVDNADIQPIFSYDNPPSGSSSVVGGYVYRGSEFPSLQGWYITVDFYSGQLWCIRPDGTGGWTVAAQTGLPAFIASISETNDGSVLYAVSLGGNAVYRVVVPFVTPLSLIRFYGRTGSGYNDILWTAEAEENIGKYEVEYSADGSVYAKAGEIPAISDGNKNDYVFRHNSHYSSKTFYRLKIIERDGSFYYSPVITVRNNDKSNARIYPTLISGGFVNIISDKAMEKVSLFSADGRMILSCNMYSRTGYFTLPLPSLQKGVYLIQLTGTDFRQTEKIIIQ
ncbi:MAG: PQQ-dependent sugar dehydrogenase [Chitinophagaceae bacterium]|nr:PQQ-dependent sugar dehydrogenase [Chitinophagaceae bacterium]